MNIPGSVLLNTALRVINKFPFDWYAFASRSIQPNGQYIANYAAPVALLGSVQPVARNLYQEYGLDFDKLYLKFFVPSNVMDVGRDVSGDLLTFQGNTYQCLSITPWYGIDGWVEILAVQIQNIPLVIGMVIPAAGNYDTSAELQFSLTFNQIVTITGTPYIALGALSGVIGGNATYVSGSGTTTLNFAYTVASGDTADGITVASPAQGAISNAAGVPANATFPIPDLSGVMLNA